MRPVIYNTTISTTDNDSHSSIALSFDYRNSLLCGLPSYQLARIQSVLNAAAPIVYGGKRSDHITPVLHDRLHWLWVPERIRFKLCVMVIKALHHLAPEYIMNCCVPVSNTAHRADLRSPSHHLMDIPRTRTKFGERSFAIAGPAAWNALPVSVRAASSVDLFKWTFKSHLFLLSFLSSSDISF